MKTFLHNRGRAWLFLAVFAVFLPSCSGSTSNTRHGGGDDVASGFEQRIERLSEAIEAQDLDQAQDLAKDLKRYRNKNRRALELHPEGSMLFARDDAVQRRMRQLESLIAKRQAAQARETAEASVRQPIERASNLAQQLQKAAAPISLDQVKALSRALDETQDALNDGRREKKINVDGAFAQEMQTRLDTLQKTRKRMQGFAQAGQVLALLIQGDEKLAAQQGPGDIDEKTRFLAEARQAYVDCQSQAEKLVTEKPSLAGYRVPIPEQRRPVKFSSVAKRCKNSLAAVDTATKSIKQAQQSQAAMQGFLKDKSEDQKRIAKKWQRVPDVSRSKKGKLVWIYVDKRGRKRSRHEYTFDASGRLVRQRKR